MKLYKSKNDTIRDNTSNLEATELKFLSTNRAKRTSCSIEDMQKYMSVIEISFLQPSLALSLKLNNNVAQNKINCILNKLFCLKQCGKRGGEIMIFREKRFSF